MSTEHKLHIGCHLSSSKGFLAMNHFDTSGVFISMLFRTTDFFALVTSF